MEQLCAVAGQKCSSGHRPEQANAARGSRQVVFKRLLEAKGSQYSYAPQRSMASSAKRWSQVPADRRPKSGPQLERQIATSEAPWRPNSDLEQAQLNSAALAWHERHRDTGGARAGPLVTRWLPKPELTALMTSAGER
jgi:hypothetical protein